MKLIDIHAHLLPFWDDGADSWETAISMLKQAEEDGIAEVVCTPHILSKQDFNKAALLLETFAQLTQRAEMAGVNVKIHMGAEIFIHPQMDLHSPIATPAANGRYYLVEFPMSMTPETVIQSFLKEIVKDKIPVIAHPERYLRVLNHPAEAWMYVKSGALLQLNAGSILGKFGQMVKDISHFLLNANWVHFVASDAHDVRSRPLRLKSAYEYVAHKWGEERAKQLFIINPAHLLQGEPIKSDPKPFEEKKKNKWEKYIPSLNKK